VNGWVGEQCDKEPGTTQSSTTTSSVPATTTTDGDDDGPKGSAATSAINVAMLGFALVATALLF